MTATIIGISSGLLIIFFIGILKQPDKKIIYGLVLSGIGLLYVGFVWTNLQALVVNSIQAVLFVFLAYYGIKKSQYFLAVGYLLHGCCDITYHSFKCTHLFYISLDFTISVYLLMLYKLILVKKAFN